MDGSFESCVKKVVTQYISKVADDEIEKQCNAFREKLLGMKGDIVGRIVNGMDVLISAEGYDGYTIKIILKR